MIKNIFNVLLIQFTYQELLWPNKNAVNFLQHKKITLNICQ